MVELGIEHRFPKPRPAALRHSVRGAGCGGGRRGGCGPFQPWFSGCDPRHHHLWGVAALWCCKCDMSRQGKEQSAAQQWSGMSSEPPQPILSEFGSPGKARAFLTQWFAGCAAVLQTVPGRRFRDLRLHLPLLWVSFCRASGHFAASVLFLTRVLEGGVALLLLLKLYINVLYALLSL